MLQDASFLEFRTPRSLWLRPHRSFIGGLQAKGDGCVSAGLCCSGASLPPGSVVAGRSSLKCKSKKLKTSHATSWRSGKGAATGAMEQVGVPSKVGWRLNMPREYVPIYRGASREFTRYMARLKPRPPGLEVRALPERRAVLVRIHRKSRDGCAARRGADHLMPSHIARIAMGEPPHAPGPISNLKFQIADPEPLTQSSKPRRKSKAADRKGLRHRLSRVRRSRG
jgi:hypothetical protein